nr:Arl5 [Planomonas micra]
MGVAFAKLWARFRTQEFKVVVVGLNNAGKTTTVYKLHLGEVVVTSPTIGSNVEEVTCPDKPNVKFQMWDLGGQDSLRQSWATYYANTTAVILVIDSTDRERVDVIRKELYGMLEHDDLASAVLLVFANKQDVKGAMPPGEISTALGLHTLKNREWHIEGSCALTGQGLDEGLRWIASRTAAA